VKIASLPLLPQRWPHFAMQLANPHSYIAVKEISVSALQLLSVYLDFATQCPLAPLSQCRQALLHKF
jgi:hypothetical protein